MANNIIQNENENLTLDPEQEPYVKLDIGGSNSSQERDILLEVNNQDDVFDFQHNQIVITRKSLNDFTDDGSLSFDMMVGEIGKLRDEFNVILDDYLLIDKFYEYYSNKDDVSQYIHYDATLDMLFTEKNFASKGTFVIYYDEDSFESGGGESGGDSSEGGGESSGGTYDHTLLTNRDSENQHPISSITNLTETLASLLSLSDISEWALSTTKPAYSWDEITSKPNIYNDLNANLFTVDWRVKNLYAAENVVIFSDSECESGGGDGFDHSLLINRDQNNQHPISAITGLTEALQSCSGGGGISSWSDILDKPSWIDSFDPDDKLNVSGGTITGDLRLHGDSNYGNKICFGDSNYVYMYEYQDDDFMIHADNLLLDAPTTISNNLYCEGTVVVYSTDGSTGGGSSSGSGGGGGTYYHDQLQNRDQADQHTISSITGLQTALDSIISEWDDITGKPSWIGSSKPSYSWSEISSRPTALSDFTKNIDFDERYYVQSDVDTLLDAKFNISGGTIISDDSYALTIETTQDENYIRLWNSSGELVTLGYFNNEAYLCNEVSYARISISDSAELLFHRNGHLESYDVYNATNSNLFSVDWKAKDIRAAGTVVMYAV